MNLIISLIIASLILLTLVTKYTRLILYFIHTRCEFLKRFILLHSGFFTLLFIFIFAIEQVILIIVTLISDVPTWFSTFIALFALSVVTTASCQKFIWEFKFSEKQKESLEFSIKNRQTLTEYKQVMEEKIKLKEEIQRLKKRK